jgi:hypothetical protein
MIGRLASLLRGRGRVPPALEERLTALKRVLGVKMEAQLVVLAQALAEVVTGELARERQQLRLELAAPRQGAGQGTSQDAGTGQSLGRATGQTLDGRAPWGSLLERAAVDPAGTRAARAKAWGARP